MIFHSQLCSHQNYDIPEIRRIRVWLIGERNPIFGNLVSRLFGHTEKHRKKLAEEGGLYPVACLVKDEDEELMDCGLRALSELSNK